MDAGADIARKTKVAYMCWATNAGSISKQTKSNSDYRLTDIETQNDRTLYAAGKLQLLKTEMWCIRNCRSEVGRVKWNIWLWVYVVRTQRNTILCYASSLFPSSTSHCRDLLSIHNIASPLYSTFCIICIKLFTCTRVSQSAWCVADNAVTY